MLRHKSEFRAARDAGPLIRSPSQERQTSTSHRANTHYQHSHHRNICFHILFLFLTGHSQRVRMPSSVSPTQDTSTTTVELLTGRSEVPAGVWSKGKDLSPKLQAAASSAVGDGFALNSSNSPTAHFRSTASSASRSTSLSPAQQMVNALTDPAPLLNPSPNFFFRCDSAKTTRRTWPSAMPSPLLWSRMR